MKNLTLLFTLAPFCIFTFFPVFCVNAQLPRLKVSDNQRFLIQENEDPFFWLADTAWELIHRCDREEVIYYLDKRAEQGFNVVQAVALAEIDGLNTPSSMGERPLVNNDPSHPNEAYFQHVDFVLEEAAKRNIYVALLPTWGDKVFTSTWGKGPEVFDEKNAKSFGEYLGNRYKDQTNLIWVIGGDRNPREEDIPIWSSMAEGVLLGVGAEENALMTFHPQPAKPGGSSNWFHKEDWLDFNMHQTGHCPNQPTYKLIKHDYELSPTKPTLDGEPLYEDHPNCFNAKELGHSIPEDIRRIMYWNVFAGAFGQTYGCHAVWQMYTNDREPINAPLRPWKVALDLPMANQVRHLKDLMLSRPFLTREPAWDMVKGTQEDDKHFVIATRDSEGSYAMVYFPTGKPVEINTTSLKSANIMLTWFDPRTGNFIPTENSKGGSSLKITPPTEGEIGHDWVLIMDAE
ncbi:glycoside hydrolase family 140 protein [Pleomorphovibrio marinus]|uniref:glycoside hydrolase family 140 protein n=1 Tax=Pleomorphovibrio marinus TaxID=2164132 RepID=UPI000E0BC5E2|nr:glycoside hydrolase family 140 protein [Pleomorphovibrio marinus]